MKTTVLAATLALGLAHAAPQAPLGQGGFRDMLGDLLKANGGSIPHGPAPSGCAKHEILVARGTGEPGAFGVVVGDPLVNAVVDAVPGSRGYAVQYPANANPSSAQIGADDLIKRLNAQSKLCPDETFALVGYSQGGGVVHAAFDPNRKPYEGVPTRVQLDPGVASKIKAVVLFGDPGYKGTQAAGTWTPWVLPDGLQAKLRENCAPGDPVCDPKGADFNQHLKYIDAEYQAPSAAFIEAAFKGETLPKAPTSYLDP